MRNIGHRKEQPVSFSASAELLREGARFNDEIHRLPTGGTTRIVKGIYRFKSQEEADCQVMDSVVSTLLQALSRSKGCVCDRS